mmetsp:Transcript_45455/g.51312  ORF Transcript_45455/g.51312 Transcript_45455/m.51312 type:complete len:437 (-) Transcript_45455:27-1337(-)
MSTPSLSAMAMMSPHRNVLEADPDNEESKQKLVDELRSRGRAAVKAKNWMDAKLLYEKVLTISTVDNKNKAIFHSNLSLVENKMGQMEKARIAAEAATQKDENYVKGWWRLGQALTALHRLQDALEAYSKAKVLDSTNKTLIKEHQKVQKLVDEEESLMTDDVDTTNNSTSTTPLTTKTTQVVCKEKSSKSPGEGRINNNNSNKEKDVENDSKLFTKSDPIRGYKVVNGKKTSYFHNELDEKSKALIGDIAPKKIENTTAHSGDAGGNNNNSNILGTSVWNGAGTWEEKNVTNWAKDTLTKSILQTKYTLPSSSPAPSALVTVEKVTKLDGHASVVVVRGKMRFIYEFCCKLEWQLKKDDDDLNCRGSLTIPDIDGTIALGEGYEIHDFIIDSVSDNSVKPVVDRFVHRGGLNEKLNEKIDDWVRLFREEYGAKNA